MKSQFQTLSFLSFCTPKTDLDAEFINSFLTQRFNITPKSNRNAPTIDANPLDVQSLIQWFESDTGALKIAFFENKVVLLGKCTLDECEIIGSLEENGTINTTPYPAPASEIRSATEDEVQSFQAALLNNDLQPDPNTLRLVPKYIPGVGHRVIFYDFALEVQGVGVVRDITAEGDVVFFCYFTYPDSEGNKGLGYSMYENPGYNLRSMIFENIDKENQSTVLGNSTSCFRRLGRELEKVGKVWKDKLLRVEPVNTKAEVGGRYYYISDKLKIVAETEKGAPASHARYLAGNYFISHIAASRTLAKIDEILRSYLASERWPDPENF